MDEVLNGRYNKTKLQKPHWNAEGVAHAFHEAAAIDAGLQNGFDPERNSTRVYALWEAILRSSNHSQLPEVLRGLLK